LVIAVGIRQSLTIHGIALTLQSGAVKPNGGAAVAAVTSKEQQQHDESRAGTHALEFTYRVGVVLGAGDALIIGETPHFLGAL
jgi:hypothetical protein